MKPCLKRRGVREEKKSGMVGARDMAQQLRPLNALPEDRTLGGSQHLYLQPQRISLKPTPALIHLHTQRHVVRIFRWDSWLPNNETETSYDKSLTDRLALSH